MKTKIITISLILFMSCSLEKPISDLELLRKKISAQFISSDVNEDRVRDLIENIKEDGSWPGIELPCFLIIQPNK